MKEYAAHAKPSETKHSLAPSFKPLPWARQSPISTLQRKPHCACGGDCPRCRQKTQGPTLQTKLQVSAPADEYEQEADRIAEQVVRRPDAPHDLAEPVGRDGSEPLLRRKCSACEKPPRAVLHDQAEQSDEVRRDSFITQTIQRQSERPRKEEEEEEEEEELLQARRAPGEGFEVGARFETDLGAALSGSSHPLPESELAFFESRLGHDFRHVRIHSDGKAADCARALSAQAFTRERDIFFGAGQYRPHEPGGRELLAHELVHTIQQGASPQLHDARPSQAAGAMPHSLNPSKLTASRSPQHRVQRSVSPDMPTIRRNLTRPFPDLVITDAEASAVLDILGRLGQIDLRDTVAVMEQEGLVNELFDNVSDADRANRTDLLQRIQDVRVFPSTTGPVVNSCSPAQMSQTGGRVNDTKAWARSAAAAVSGFITGTGVGDVSAIGLRLDRHFFHQQNTGRLTLERQQNYAQRILENFEKVEAQANPYTLACASPFDALCGALAGAYNDHTRRTVMFCPSYFSNSAETQVLMLFHELTHSYTGVADRGYSHERIFDYLPPNDSIDNAEAYTMFALDTVTGRNASATHLRAVSDQITDCGDPQSQRASELRRSMAYAARMVKNALNIIGDPDYSTHHASVPALRHFKTISRTDLTRVIDRYRSLNQELEGSISFECEADCPPGRVSYYYSVVGSTAHICPAYFSISSEDGRVDQLLLAVTMEELDMSAPLDPQSPAYTSMTADQAYGNATSYVGYARDVTNQAFQPGHAEFRYGRDIRSDFEYESTRLLAEISESDSLRATIESRYVDPLKQDLEQQLAAHPPSNAAEADSIRQTFITRLTEMMALARRLSEGYSPFAIDADIRGLLIDAPSQAAYQAITSALKERMRADLRALLDPLASDIRSGAHRAMNQWPALDALVARYRSALQAANSYLPVYRRANEVVREFSTFITRIETRHPARTLSELEGESIVEDFLLQRDIRNLKDDIVTRILAGTPYAPRTGLADPDQLLRLHERNLRQFEHNLRNRRTR